MQGIQHSEYLRKSLDEEVLGIRKILTLTVQGDVISTDFLCGRISNCPGPT